MRRSSRLTAAGVAIALLVSGCSAASHPAAAGKPAAATGAGTGPGWSEHAAAGGVAAQVAGHGWTVALRAPGPVGSTLTLGDPGARPELPAARAALGTLAKAADVAAGDPVAVELAGGALPAAGATLTRTLSTSVPANARATLAYYDPTHDAWTAWPTTLSADRRTLTAPVSHFTIVDDIVYGAGWLLDTRTGAPSCPGAVPAWARAGVTFLDDLNAPLRWCVGADPADANELLVKVAVNRGYGVTVTPKATPARVADSIFNGATDDVLVRIMAGALSLPNNFGRGVLLVPGGATAELAFSEAAVRAAGGHPLISVNAAAEYMVAGMTYTAITNAYGDGDGPAAVVIALLAVAQCITSFGPALVAGDFSAAAAAALKCLASNAEDIGRDLASVLAKQFPKVAAEDLGKVAGRVGGHLWQVWAAGLVFGVATWFADQKLDGAAWTLNVFPKALPPPGATLPTFDSSAANAAKLESFVRSGVSGLPAVAGTDGCLVYEVYGADLARGALDVYIGVPGGACGGDAAGSYYQIRDRRVVATVAHCGDCDPPDSTVTRFTAPYRNRPAAGLFTLRSGGASDWRLVGGAPG